MNQYIITEEELLDTRSYIYHEDEVAFSRIESKVRSHPYQSERDRVLDDLQRFVRVDRGVNFQIGKRLVLNKIAELRAGSP